MTSALSTILSEKKSSILDQWEKSVKAALPAARKESRSALRDSIPEFLDDLIHALETSFKDQRTEIVRFAHKHGAERANLSEYSIEDALFEFNLLRKTIFSELESVSPVTPAERDLILEGIHLGMSKAGAEYSKMQMRKVEDERTRFRRIADIQPALIGHVDNENRYLFVNQAYEDWFNTPVEEILGKTVECLIGKEAFEILEPYLAQAREGKKVVFEKHIRYKDGQTKFTLSTFSPDIGADGRIQGVFISVSDLTEQRKALEAYMRSEEEFRNLSNALPQISWVADREGRVTWFNERFYEFSGLGPEESLGWGWLKIHGEVFKTTGKDNLLEHVRNGKVWEDTFPLYGKEKKWRWFLSRAIPIRDNNGLITRWLGTCTDVTEQKQISDSLHKEQVMRDKFISALSHDLRTPLTSASLSAQLIPRKTNDEKVKTLAQKIMMNLRRVDKMIEDLLDANRLRAGQKITPKIEELDLAQLTVNTVNDLETIYGDRFVLDVPYELPAFLSVHGMRRIIENLCSNAIKYGSTSAPVSIYLHRERDEVELGVHNFGNPLKDKDTSRLFEEYVRHADDERSGKKGWGIGLSIVKGVVEAQGGSVDISSDENGTLFKVRLPLDARSFVNHSDENLIH